MKKLLIIAAAMLIGLQANAQLRADGGFMHAMETFKWNESSADGFSLDGAYLGAKYNISLYNLVEGLSVEPGANLSLLFGKEHLAILPYSISEIGINIPVHARYTYEITNDFSIYGLFGPTMQYGLDLRAKDGNNSYRLYGDNNTGVSRNPFNLYLGLAAGIEVAQMIHVNVGFDFGLLNMSTTSRLGINRNQLKIGVGYIF